VDGDSPFFRLILKIATEQCTDYTCTVPGKYMYSMALVEARMHRSSMASVEVDGYSMLQSNRLECEVVNFHQTHMYTT